MKFTVERYERLPIDETQLAIQTDPATASSKSRAPSGCAGCASCGAGIAAARSYGATTHVPTAAPDPQHPECRDRGARRTFIRLAKSRFTAILWIILNRTNAQ